MSGKMWSLLRDTAASYVDDNCLSRGAAIAYYSVFALLPVIVLVIAVAGIVFGSDEARTAIVQRIDSLVGDQGRDAVQVMLQAAPQRGSGLFATTVGVVTLLAAASAVFGEIQAALNVIWRAVPRKMTAWRLVRTRLLGLLLILCVGLLLVASVIASAALGALGTVLSEFWPEIQMPLQLLNAIVSFFLIAALFAAVYKLLPDVDVAWREAGFGAAVTAALFAVGKYLIALYIAHTTIASSYGAAGAFAVLLVWVYYSSQIVLVGAEFTRCFATTYGSWREGGPRFAAAGGHGAEIAGLRARLAATTGRTVRTRRAPAD
jgi:membrane protein